MFCLFNFLYLSFSYIFIENKFQKTENNYSKQEVLNITELSNSFSKENTNVKNIYFIILDAMMSLENAETLKIIKKDNIIKKINTLGIKYIANSHSSYNYTHLTLASIMEINYLNLETNNNINI